jgi:sporulation protein YlmC with PRC-barrel domain
MINSFTDATRCAPTIRREEVQARSLELDAKNKAKDIKMRRQIMSLAGALALAAAPLTSQALAQTGGTPGANLPFATQQSANEFLARVFIGQAVHNTAGERLGDVNDLAFDRKGHISTVVIGVGGFLSIGEKNVGVPFSALTFKVGKDGERVVAIALTKQDLAQAPAFKATEKTTFERVKEQATDLGQMAADKAVELKDQASQKIESMRKSEPVKQ